MGVMTHTRNFFATFPSNRYDMVQLLNRMSLFFCHSIEVVDYCYYYYYYYYYYAYSFLSCLVMTSNHCICIQLFSFSCASSILQMHCPSHPPKKPLSFFPLVLFFLLCDAVEWTNDAYISSQF